MLDTKIVVTPQHLFLRTLETSVLYAQKDRDGVLQIGMKFPFLLFTYHGFFIISVSIKDIGFGRIISP